MKRRSEIRRVQTTLGELVSALWEETETLFELERNERRLVVAYVLNALLTRPDYRSHRFASRKR
jgi:hypothetical protein